ncbi:SgcJ/EcaC family oxidoreductase [Fulvivirga sedimenti]|jgi:uncharacterized protein (TIGR02246 family)|uniref:SgcJ/EcaC family oxidoreductase n=1 Tax=Fulvivirga sedimenti TaxID=2879465 RepID=A0A9X1KV39_9BACT|nr:SgcJ/EcaC family oxidoreductase [Fulvivirga sedimenti]MCA6074268.1 SgcJ/EcaC family oxidoreductase [Fulvivirga sedimenti]
MSDQNITYLQNPEYMPNAFADAWNERDAHKIAGLFSSDAEFVNVVGLWWHNRADIFKAHDYGLKNIFQHSQLSVGTVKQRRLSDSAAVIHARMKLDGQTSHGGIDNPGTRRNIFTFVMQKQENGWVCVAAHNTDVIPGKETNIVDSKNQVRPVDYRK